MQEYSEFLWQKLRASQTCSPREFKRTENRLIRELQVQCRYSAESWKSKRLIPRRVVVDVRALMRLVEEAEKGLLGQNAEKVSKVDKGRIFELGAVF